MFSELRAVKTASEMRPVILSDCEGARKLFINAPPAALQTPFNSIFRRVMHITLVCGAAD